MNEVLQIDIFINAAWKNKWKMNINLLTLNKWVFTRGLCHLNQ